MAAAMTQRRKHDKSIEEAAAIGAKVRSLRERRRWSQAHLARELGISQPGLSQIERGEAVLSAPALLRVLRLFNVGVETFAGEPFREDSGVQNALARHGAAHLLETDAPVPSRLDDPAALVWEVLRNPESPRHVLALAPVLIASVDQISLGNLAGRLALSHRESRLGWLLESIRIALGTLEASPRLSDQRAARRLEVVISLALEGGLLRPPLDSEPLDALDSDIRSMKTVERLEAEATPEARRWRIATRLRAEDFADALVAAREAR